MSIKPNQVYSINFTLKDEEGEIIDSTQKGQPMSFISGQGLLIPRLEEEIGSMIIGSKKTVVLSPEEAYGEYEDEAVQTVTRADFPDDAELEIGMEFYTNTPEGEELPFVITDIEGDNITIDFNHPLAGMTLTFDIELVNVREATPEELAHGHVHGAGGHHH